MCRCGRQELLQHYQEPAHSAVLVRAAERYHCQTWRHCCICGGRANLQRHHCSHLTNTAQRRQNLLPSHAMTRSSNSSTAPSFCSICELESHAHLGNRNMDLCFVVGAAGRMARPRRLQIARTSGCRRVPGRARTSLFSTCWTAQVQVHVMEVGIPVFMSTRRARASRTRRATTIRLLTKRYPVTPCCSITYCVVGNLYILHRVDDCVVLGTRCITISRQ